MGALEQELDRFIIYLHTVKNTSSNTEMSYKRDLTKLFAFLSDRKIYELKDISEEVLIQFVDWLQNVAGAGHTQEEILWKHCPKSNLLTVHLLQQKLLISVTEEKSCILKLCS